MPPKLHFSKVFVIVLEYYCHFIYLTRKTSSSVCKSSSSVSSTEQRGVVFTTLSPRLPPFMSPSHLLPDVGGPEPRTFISSTGLTSGLPRNSTSRFTLTFKVTLRLSTWGRRMSGTDIRLNKARLEKAVSGVSGVSFRGV